jgi:hypothetical protein
VDFRRQLGFFGRSLWLACRGRKSCGQIIAQPIMKANANSRF